MKDHRDIIFTALALSAVFAAGCPETQHLDPCSVFVCGDNGACETDADGQPSCVCDDGFTAGPLGCLPDGPDGDGDGDADCVDVVDLNAQATPVPGGLVYQGTLEGGPGNHSGSCGGDGAEQIFTYTPPTSGVLVASTAGSDFDTVLYLRGQCDAPEDELGCNDDAFVPQSTIEYENGVEGETYSIFVDSLSPAHSGDFTLTVGLQTTAGEGGECVPATPLVLCPEGMVCDPSDRQCFSSGAPRLLEVTAVRFPTNLVRITAWGRDPDGDTSHFGLNFISPEGDRSDVGMIPFDIPVSGQEAFIATRTIEAFPPSTFVEQIEVTLVDEADHRSSMLSTMVGDVARPAEGQDCDPALLFDLCQPGLICVPEAETCIEGHPPELSLARSWLTAEGEGRLELTGADSDSDVLGFDFTFIDAEGSDIDLDLDIDGDGTPETTDLLGSMIQPVVGEAEFVIRGLLEDHSHEMIAPPEGAEGVRVELLDIAGLESESVATFWEPLPIIGAGEDCDPAAWTDRCVEGYACYEETGTCVPPLETLCDEEFPDLPLGEVVAGELNGLSSLTAGTCGGDGPEDVYRLVIPAGVTDVTITTDLPGTGGTDTVLYVRGLCEAPTDAEVVCNDDDGSVRSTVGFPATEGELFYIFIDTYHAGGPYEILATAVP